MIHITYAYNATKRTRSEKNSTNRQEPNAESEVYTDTTRALSLSPRPFWVYPNDSQSTV